MLELIFCFAVAAAAPSARPAPAPGEPCPEDVQLADSVLAIQRADYRGDRAELARRALELSGKRPHRNRAYWAYWAGFASWRRGMNGFYETPRPSDLPADFERCAGQERDALALDPGLEDARAALAGCLLGLALTGGEAVLDRRAALLREATALVDELEGGAGENPRSLWMVGGRLMSAPPGKGGDLARARATFRRGLEAARREALRPPRLPWIPSWGAAENLMSLSFLHTLPPAPDRAVARAYAEGALALVPDWHFVRDVLLPRIDGLPDRPPDPPP
jgi:hypothetical protein